MSGSKCFSCSNEAAAIVNTCSPTSASGMTEPRPRCEVCIANMHGVNITQMLVSEKEFQELLKNLKRNEQRVWVRKVRK